MGRTLALICEIVVAVALGGAGPPNKAGEARKLPEHTQSVQAAPLQPAAAADYAPYPDRYADSCYNSKEHDTADLCAQWRAAVAAEKAAKATLTADQIAGISALLSFAAVILLVWTGNETRKTATAAIKSHEAFLTAEDACLVFDAVVMGKGSSTIDCVSTEFVRLKIKVANVGKGAARLSIVSIGGEKFELTDTTVPVGDAEFVGPFHIDLDQNGAANFTVIAVYATALCEDASASTPFHVWQREGTDKFSARSFGIKLARAPRVIGKIEPLDTPPRRWLQFWKGTA